MPLGIKNIMETADMPTKQGSPLFVGWRTGRDAASVAALREAGAVILGKVVRPSSQRASRTVPEIRGTPNGPPAGRAAVRQPRWVAAW